jgi:hypothetical protein
MRISLLVGNLDHENTGPLIGLPQLRLTWVKVVAPKLYLSWRLGQIIPMLPQEFSIDAKVHSCLMIVNESSLFFWQSESKLLLCPFRWELQVPEQVGNKIKDWRSRGAHLLSERHRQQERTMRRSFHDISLAQFSICKALCSPSLKTDSLAHPPYWHDIHWPAFPRAISRSVCSLEA